MAPLSFAKAVLGQNYALPSEKRPPSATILPMIHAWGAIMAAIRNFTQSIA
jgi:hypothetical protein